MKKSITLLSLILLITLVVGGASLVFLVLSLVVTILFIMSQKKLADKFQNINETDKISSVWLWTQLIPLWGYIALVVTAVKLDEQNKIYAKNKGIEKGPFKVSYVYWYVGMILASLIPVINIITIVANLVLFIFVWVNISKSAKALSNTNPNTN